MSFWNQLWPIAKWFLEFSFEFRRQVIARINQTLSQNLVRTFIEPSFVALCAVFRDCAGLKIALLGSSCGAIRCRRYGTVSSPKLDIRSWYAHDTLMFAMMMQTNIIMLVICIMLLILSFSWNCFSYTASQAGNPFISWPHRDKGLSWEETKRGLHTKSGTSSACWCLDICDIAFDHFRSYLFPTTFVAGKWIQQLELSFPYNLHINENYSFHLCMCVCVC